MVNQKDPVTKEDLKTFKEEIVHQFRIISEDLRSDVKQVAEGVLNVNERLDKTRQELKEEIDAKTDVISHAVISLDQKVTSLDQKVVTLDQKVTSLDQKVVTLDQKVTSLDQKLDKSRQELKTEIQETRQEVLAAIKFSYAELDRRLTTLEKEFLELKHRVDKMESRSAS
jgi:chromosome segregation ATPase